MGVNAGWEIAKACAEVQTAIDPLPANVAVYAERLAVFTETYHALKNISFT